MSQIQDSTLVEIYNEALRLNNRLITNALEKEFPKHFPIFKPGDHFLINKKKYMLAATGAASLCFISTKNGERWSDPKSGDPRYITIQTIRTLIGDKAEYRPLKRNEKVEEA